MTLLKLLGIASAIFAGLAMAIVVAAVAVVLLTIGPG